MLYRLKNDTHIRVSNGRGYITSIDTHADLAVDESGAIFLNALSRNPQTLEQLCDKLLETFVGVDRETILPDAREFYDSLVAQRFLVSGESEAELDAKDTAFVYDADSQTPSSRDTVNFYIPGFDLKFLNFYRSMIAYMREFPHRFMENIRIPVLYGSFNNMLWNGGRIRLGRQATYDEMRDAIKAVNDMGVAVRYTYTNSAIEERHLGDTLCNLSMELANNGKNEVLVNSPILENYLRKQYPNFKYILSTTACERNIDKINEATKKYDLVVLDYRDNRNFEFLEKIQDKDKIEILVDDYCPSFCHFRKKHYNVVSRVNLYQCNATEGGCMETQRPKNIIGFYQNLETFKDTNLTNEDIYGKYHDMGFRNFKLIGRDDRSLFTFESYMYYMVNPEWRDRVRDELIGYYVDYIIKYYGGNKTVTLDQPIPVPQAGNKA